MGSVPTLVAGSEKKCGKGGEMGEYTVRNLEGGCDPRMRFRLQKGAQK